MDQVYWCSFNEPICLCKRCVEWPVLVKGRRGKGGGEEERFKNCEQRMK